VGQMHPDEGTRSNAKMHYHKKWMNEQLT
jgi:hypothetical protein